MTRKPFVHQHRQGVSKFAQLRLILFVGREPGVINQRLVSLKQRQPASHQGILHRRRCFLLEEDRPDCVDWNRLVLLPQKLKRLTVEIFQRSRVDRDIGSLLPGPSQ